MKGYVYILSNYTRTTFYIGVTSNLGRRLEQHMEDPPSSFVARYNLKYLVYYEVYERIEDAIRREKQLKRWHREWKINLIKSVNPEMLDLSDQVPWQ